jgi:type IV fimbrial biogenesis protein FimT
MHTPRRSLKGLTLIELMIALAVVAVVSAFAAPALGTFAANGRLRMSTLDLVESIAFARAQAVSRRMPVSLCRSANPAASAPSCGGSERDWSTGWIVFVDVNADGSYALASDTLLRAVAGSSGEARIRTNDQANRNLQFGANGTTLEGDGTVIFAVCDDREGSMGRQVIVPPIGRAWVARGTEDSPINCQDEG